MDRQYQDDEIDLRELMLDLWRGKWIVIGTTFLGAAIAIAFALYSQEWWSAKTLVTSPQESDVSTYVRQVQQFQPVFDTYLGDGTVLKGHKLDALSNGTLLFKRFIEEFNSLDNKKVFLTENTDWLKLTAGTSEDSLEKLYLEWSKLIVAVPKDKKAKSSPYSLSFQAMSPSMSYSFLTDYIGFISEVTSNAVMSDVESVIISHKESLEQQYILLEQQTRHYLDTEIVRSQYAFSIAQAAGVATPTQLSERDEVFPIDMGSRALHEKNKALKSIKDLSILEPRLQILQTKMSLLTSIELNKDIKFQMYRVLETATPPLTRDKPKRALIAVLGTLLGGMLGVMVVLGLRFFRKSK